MVDKQGGIFLHLLLLWGRALRHRHCQQYLSNLDRQGKIKSLVTLSAWNFWVWGTCLTAFGALAGNRCVLRHSCGLPGGFAALHLLSYADQTVGISLMLIPY
jgi:hypothetical protein